MQRKNEYKIFYIQLVKVEISTCLSLVLLSIFAFGYKYTGSHISNTTGATDYKWNSNQYIGGMEEGFSWLKVDEEGFNNFYRPESIDILFMGSSMVEGFNVAKDKNMAVQLSNILNKNIYNIGVSGHYLDSSIDNLNSALTEYRPSEYVIIETHNLDLTDGEMEAVINGTRIKQISREGIISALSKYLPSVKLIYLGIDNWRHISVSEFNNCNREENVSLEETFSEEHYLLLKKMLNKLHVSADKAGVQPIIFWLPEMSIRSDEGCEYNNTSKIFEDFCLQENIIFIDMTGPFNELYKEKNTLPYGFANTRVGIGHLNEYGHQVVAETLAEVIEKDGAN